MQALGQEIAKFISAEGVALIVLLIGLFLYLRFLNRHRQKPEDTKENSEQDSSQGFSQNSGTLSETELERYARHITLREVGGAGQMRLRAARVLVIGAGGLGCPILAYLTAAGVGTIGVIDDDSVTLSNLQRQVLFDESSLGMPKVFAAQARLNLLNPHVKILPYHRRFTAEVAAALADDFDLIIDGSDNFATRQLVNKVCWRGQKTFIFGAIGPWEGQVSLFNPHAKNAACYACVFPNQPSAAQMPSCAESGVMGAVPAIIGAVMAAEAIKWITKTGGGLEGQMLLYDALAAESRKIKLTRNKACRVCGKAT